MRDARWPLWFAALLIAGCAGGPEPAPTPAGGPGLVDLGGVTLDPARRRVLIEGRVAIDAHDPQTPTVYLELVACGPDSREHESLVVIPARPSTIHAALLSLGLEPGTPARVTFAASRIERSPATGAPLRVTFLVDGKTVDPAAWVVHRRTGERWQPGGWVFAGSRIATRQGREVYDADGTGTVIGLASFGAEVIAPLQAISPEAAVDEPVWIADRAALPRQGTPVTIVIEPESPGTPGSELQPDAD